MELEHGPGGAVGTVEATSAGCRPVVRVRRSGRFEVVNRTHHDLRPGDEIEFGYTLLPEAVGHCAADARIRVDCPEILN